MNKHSYTILAAALQLTAAAAVPVAWTNSPGMPPYPIKPVPHGSTVDLAVTLKGYTTPPIAPGADVRLWYQTNGMGSAWWSAPATFDGSTITATFGPAQDCGADRVSLFFGAPSNVFASAVLRLTHAPGFTPSELTLPVQRLDFASVEIANAPYYTKAETESKIAELSPPTSLAPATNYTDSATNALSSVLRDTIAESTPGNYAAVSNAAMSAAAQTNDFLRLTGGTMRGDIDMGGRAPDGDIAPEASSSIQFMEFSLEYGTLGSGFGIYRCDDYGRTPEYLFNGSRWEEEYGSDEDVMTRYDLANAIAGKRSLLDDNVYAAVTTGDVWTATTDGGDPQILRVLEEDAEVKTWSTATSVQGMGELGALSLICWRQVGNWDFVVGSTGSDNEYRPDESPTDFEFTVEGRKWRLTYDPPRAAGFEPTGYRYASTADLTSYATSNDVSTAIPPAISNVVTKSYVEDLGITSEEEDPVWSAEKSNYATKGELGDVADDLADLRTESALVYRLYSGSNVVAEVTNYNSAVHAPELRLMQLNESNEYVTVWAETNGLARTLAAANKHTDSATNELKHIYAPRAWSRTTSGLGADAPANTTWISTPRTVIAGGLEYAKIVDTYGEVWVLTSNGMAMDFDPDTNAFFRITADDGTPVVSIEKSDAQVVGAYAEGTTVSANSVTMPVPVVSATAPTMYWRNQLESGDWSDQSTPPTGATVSWSGTAGSWVCTVTFSGTRPPSMFFKFSFPQEGGVVIRNNATTDLSSGIWVNGTKFVPSVSGNNLIWTKQ